MTDGTTGGGTTDTGGAVAAPGPLPPLPYGAWPSPVGPDVLATAGVGLWQVAFDGGDLYWVERRPTEGGRAQLVRRTPDGTITDLLPDGFEARTLAHEYGGGDHAVRGGTVVFANRADQRLYRLGVGDGGDVGVPVPLTPEPAVPLGDRYADMAITADGRRVYAVRERHGAGGGEPANELVVLPLDPPDGEGGPVDPVVVATGHDFVSSPALSPDGATLAWLTWDHPRMPWDGTELWTAPVAADGTTGAPRQVAGGLAESVLQPTWAADGSLWFSSDRTGWWNLYRAAPDGAVAAVAPAAAEFGAPQWQFGYRHFVLLDDGRAVAVVGDRGITRLAVVDGGRVSTLPVPCTAVPTLALATDGRRIAAVVATDREPSTLVLAQVPRHGENSFSIKNLFENYSPPAVPVDLGGAAVPVIAPSGGVPEGSAPIKLDETPGVTIVRRSLDLAALGLGDAWLPAVEPVEFATSGGATAHALYYPPTNPEATAPAGTLPPLLVNSHGGPTSQTEAMLDLSTVFWTSRGFAVVHVNYGGSSGYGRAYRERLNGNWGIVDVDDCVAAARHLAAAGKADPDRLAIRGGSAGGYTTLCALAFRDDFAAGVSYFGVADAALLAAETHKFESRYLDGLIGPWPEAAVVYRERSPIQHTDGLNCPVLLLQGLEDKVVPPSQAEAMVAALAAKGLPYAYVAFPGEQHGFRAAAAIRRAAEAELSFHGQVFGFTPGGDIPALEVHNLGRRDGEPDQ